MITEYYPIVSNLKKILNKQVAFTTLNDKNPNKLNHAIYEVISSYSESPYMEIHRQAFRSWKKETFKHSGIAQILQNNYSISAC